MGGISSGNYGGKRTTNRMSQLDIRKINRAGSLEVGLYSRTANVEIHADTNRVTLSYRRENHVGVWEEYRCAVNLDWTHCNYGGKRPWWVCPDCGKCVAVLYGGRRFACRHCHDLTYTSTRAAPGSEHYARAKKVRMKLGWGGGVASPMGDRPKGMHWKTYLRLLTQLSCHGMAALPSTDKLVTQVNNRLGRQIALVASARRTASADKQCSAGS
jgi:hypothetical protein